MSVLIDDLRGKQCDIYGESVTDVFADHITGTIIDSDDKWIKITTTDKKGKTTLQYIKIKQISKIVISD